MSSQVMVVSDQHSCCPLGQDGHVSCAVMFSAPHCVQSGARCVNDQRNCPVGQDRCAVPLGVKESRTVAFENPRTVSASETNDTLNFTDFWFKQGLFKYKVAIYNTKLMKTGTSRRGVYVMHSCTCLLRKRSINSTRMNVYVNNQNCF